MTTGTTAGGATAGAEASHEKARPPTAAAALVSTAASAGDYATGLMITLGAGPQLVAISGLRMIISAITEANQMDRAAAVDLARFIGREMLLAVDALKLRDEDAPDAREGTHGA